MEEELMFPLYVELQFDQSISKKKERFDSCIRQVSNKEGPQTQGVKLYVHHDFGNL